MTPYDTFAYSFADCKIVGCPQHLSKQQQHNENNMPRTSRKAQVVGCLSTLLKDRIKERAARMIADDDDSTEDLKDLAMAICLSEIRKIQSKYDFPHCVGIADGTLFPLAFEPQTEDAPDYSGRKYGYSLSTMIICDHTRRVRHYLAGYPGSAHDNRIFKATKLASNPNEFFDAMQYIIGDSAFENSWFMVSAFKKPRDETIPKNQESFNEKLAKLRIVSEHCIGILKGRFPWLRSIRLPITEEKKSIIRILKLLEATIILHNMLIQFKEEERKEWIIEEDDYSAVDDADRVPELSPTDVLNQAIADGAAKDERRRRLMYYFEEHFYF
jgi:DDE superfamily endonuclease